MLARPPSSFRRFSVATKHFIAGAIKHPGALRRTAVKKGLLGGEHDSLSYSDLKKLMASSNPTTAKRARLALTLRGFHHHEK
jgi:hypothetical protein